MAKKKTKAQIKRLMKRAAERGEVYVPPDDQKLTKDDEHGEEDLSKEQPTFAPVDAGKEQDRVKLVAATKLKKELETIESNEDLKAKERRSAKRKAEAIACSESGCSAKELLEWYEQQSRKHAESRKDRHETRERSHKNPYIVFIGQLAYDTTKEALFNYIQKELGKDHTISNDTVQVRLLTDPKTKKSRGMAFVEVSDPEMLYSLLKLHRTMLEGRRINVERSAGGKSNSEARKSKLKLYREEQEQYMDSAIDNVIGEYKKRGEIQEGELDDGVVSVCKRHSAAVVQAALERYVESNGRDMDNPSAYLNYILRKIAEEGIHEEVKEKKSEKVHLNKRRKMSKESRGDSNKLNASSELAKQGIDIGISSGKDGDLSAIFPSMSRGRGRGRQNPSL